jgi:hypothetical protein
MLLVERGAIGIGGIYQAQGADQGEEAVHSCKYKLRTAVVHTASGTNEHENGRGAVS